MQTIPALILFLQRFGYPLLASLIGLESLGIPLPSEGFIFIAAVGAANGFGHIGWIAFSTWIGALLGETAAYALGYRRGPAGQKSFGILQPERLALGHPFVVRHGRLAHFYARFFPMQRPMAAYLAGTRRAPLAAFLLASAAGSAVWTGVFAGAGFLLGRNFGAIQQSLERPGRVLAMLVLLGAAFIWINFRWRQNRSHYRQGRIGTILTWIQRLGRRIKKRRERWLAIYALLLVLSVWGAGILVDDWVQKEPELYRRDQVIARWIGAGSAEAPDLVEVFIFLGDIRVLAAAAAATAVWLWLNQQRRLSLLTAVNFLGALGLGWSLQVWLQRPLPPIPETFWHLTPFSFPNLPSMVAGAVFGWWTYVWARDKGWNQQVNASTGAAFVTAAVGLSTLVVGEAHLSDVLFGLPLGLLWLAIPLALASDEAISARQLVRQKAVELSPKKRLLLLGSLTIPVIVLTFFTPPIAQDPSYHHFADGRSILGIPNFFNVISNSAFLVSGAIGLLLLRHYRKTGSPPIFAARREIRPYDVFFWAIALTSFGSAYYHLAPNNTHLVWDRLPMTFGFMSLFSALIMERIDREAGLQLLTPLIVLGVGSVVYWYWGSQRGGGDLRWYVDVQFYPMMAIPLIAYFFPSRYTEGRQIYAILIWYILAKVFELLDGSIFQLSGAFLSGHTIKHLLAAGATLQVAWMLYRRRVLSTTPSDEQAVSGEGVQIEGNPTG